MKRALLILLLVEVVAIAMEKIENPIQEPSLGNKIWLLEAYMKGELELQDLSEGLYVFFDRHHSNRSAGNIIRLRDAIVYLLQAKKESRLTSFNVQGSLILNDEAILQLQLVRYRIYCDGDDLSDVSDAQKKTTIKAARERWEEAFLSQGTKGCIEQELKNKKVFAAKFRALQKVITNTCSDIVEMGCAPEKIPEQPTLCLIS